MTRSGTPRDDEAAEWVARQDSGDWSRHDEDALQVWLAGDEARHGALLRAHAAWLMIDRALIADRPIAAEPDPPLTVKRWGRRAILSGSIAAGVAFLFGRLRGGEVGDDYSTNLGEIRRVPLADGSAMTLNSSSSVAVRMEPAARRVNLTQGEAWFDVAKNAARPFIVAAGPVRAQAIGTAFSVRMRDTGVEVLVTEGVVETWSGDGTGHRTRLEAGQRAIVGADAAVRLAPTEASADRALAWRGGMIDLNGETVGEAAAEFNRYNERKVIITESGIAAERMDGVFRINDPEGFAGAVKVSLNVTIRLDDPSEIRIDRATPNEKDPDRSNKGRIFEAQVS